jgi:hypothetical protein
MILKTNNLRRLVITFFNSILSARLISVLDFILRSGMWPIGLNRGQTELPTTNEGLERHQKRPSQHQHRRTSASDTSRRR